MSDGGNAMKGIVNVRVSNARISFELRLERNITILSGDSATGKTTLVGMIRDYEEDGRSSGVTVQSPKPCRVLTNADWQYRLASITDSMFSWTREIRLSNQKPLPAPFREVATTMLSLPGRAFISFHTV